MGRLLEFLFFILLLVGLLFWLSGRYIKTRQRTREPKEAYFTGGPLNGHTKKLKVYSPKYTYEYRKILGAQDHGTFKTYNEENRIAVYDHQSDGTYVYKGSLDEAGKLVQDDPE